MVLAMSLFDRVGRFLDDVVLLPDETRKSLEAADQAVRDGLWAEAEALYADVLDTRPSLLRARVGLARVLAQTGRISEARAALDLARREAPGDARVATLAAEWALTQGDAAAAAGHARAAARTLVAEGGAEFAHACALRARAELALGRPDRAARELDKALSVRPDDADLAVEALEALCASRAPRRARAAARRLVPGALSPVAATRVGLALVDAGLERSALRFLERAASSSEPRALEALARARFADGDLVEAERRAREAVAAGALALPLLGEVLATAGHDVEAADAFEAAFHASSKEAFLHQALDVCPLDDADRLGRLAAGLAPADEWRVLAEALLALTREEPELALRLRVDAPQPRAQLARAMACLTTDQPGAALAALDSRAERLAATAGSTFAPADEAAATDLRRRALRARWTGAGGWVDLGALMEDVARFAQERALVGLQGVAHEAREALDRPLLLAVLGEFNAGKSTLINAFVGAEVAPMGIVPTTATLNVLKAGSERRVCVVYRDGSTREGDFTSLTESLEQAERQDAAPVDHVEIRLPSPLLEQVWILDTPGLNALDPRHAELAKEAARRADAVVWVFDAAQAGKATEAAVLRALRESGRPIVPVLNKSDRLAPAELERVQVALGGVLGEGEPPVALSARSALRARLAGDTEATAESGFTALLTRLEQQIFSRSRALKRRASAQRLTAAIDVCREGEERAALPERARVAELAAVRLRLRELSLDDVVIDSLRALETARDEAFAAAAEEVVAFARPRRELWGKNGADPEDRIFLEGLLERRLGEASERASRALVHDLASSLSEAVGDAGSDLPDARRLLSAQFAPAFASLSGYERGLRAGGALRRFFEDQLPRAELSAGVIAVALARARADLALELRPALLAALAEAQETLRRLAAEGEARTQRALLARVRGLLEPLSALRDVVADIDAHSHEATAPL